MANMKNPFPIEDAKASAERLSKLVPDDFSSSNPRTQLIEKARKLFQKYVKTHEPDEQYLSDLVDACEAEGTPLAQRIKEDAAEFLND